MTPVVGEPKRSLVMLVPPNPGYGQADERQVPPPKKTVGVRQRSGSARCGLKHSRTATPALKPCGTASV